jgi:hypothetical protein
MGEAIRNDLKTPRVPGLTRIMPTTDDRWDSTALLHEFQRFHMRNASLDASLIERELKSRQHLRQIHRP